MALAAEGSARKLVTVSHPVTRQSILSFMSVLPAEAVNIVNDMRRMSRLKEVGELKDAGPSHFVYPRFIGTNIQLARLVFGAKLERLESLPANVEWVNIIGEDDRLSDTVDHEKVVAARRANKPGSVTENRIIPGHGHTWAPWDRDLHNELVRSALDN